MFLVSRWVPYSLARPLIDQSPSSYAVLSRALPRSQPASVMPVAAAVLELRPEAGGNTGSSKETAACAATGDRETGAGPAGVLQGEAKIASQARGVVTGSLDGRGRERQAEMRELQAAAEKGGDGMEVDGDEDVGEGGAPRTESDQVAVTLRQEDGGRDTVVAPERVNERRESGRQVGRERVEHWSEQLSEQEVVLREGEVRNAVLQTRLLLGEGEDAPCLSFVVRYWLHACLYFLSYAPRKRPPSLGLLTHLWCVYLSCALVECKYHCSKCLRHA